MPEDLTSLLTSRQVATILNLSPEYVRTNWARMKLPGFRLPTGTIRFREPEVRAWIKSGEDAEKVPA
jgi:hypothetical protein